MDRNSQEYWRKRTLERLQASEEVGLEAIERLLPIYNQALRNIDKEIKSIFDNYALKGIVDVSELKKAMTASERRAFLRAVAENAEILGIDIDLIYDNRYLARLTRLEAIKQQIQFEVMAIAPKEVKVSEAAYTKIIKDTYKVLQKEFKLLGVQPNFTTLNDKVINEILRSRWVGGNYSSRIWKNLDEFAKELPTILGGAFSSGQSYQKTARILRERFDVSKYNATRLVRTETNYFNNQAELQSYIDDGYGEYEYDAVRDSRTSPICKKLDGDRFPIDEAQPGVNYPPMHGNCRSTTQVVLDSFTGIKPRRRTSRLTVGKSNDEIASQVTAKLVNRVGE